MINSGPCRTGPRPCWRNTSSEGPRLDSGRGQGRRPPCHRSGLLRPLRAMPDHRETPHSSPSPQAPRGRPFELAREVGLSPQGSTSLWSVSCGHVLTFLRAWSQRHTNEDQNRIERALTGWRRSPSTGRTSHGAIEVVTRRLLHGPGSSGPSRVRRSRESEPRMCGHAHRTAKAARDARWGPASALGAGGVARTSYRSRPRGTRTGYSPPPPRCHDALR